jgi:hypothetical protein
MLVLELVGSIVGLDQRIMDNLAFVAVAFRKRLSIVRHYVQCNGVWISASELARVKLRQHKKSQTKHKHLPPLSYQRPVLASVPGCVDVVTELEKKLQKKPAPHLT